MLFICFLKEMLLTLTSHHQHCFTVHSLYDEGVINEKNADTFDSSNYMQKMVFAIGEISKTVNNNDDFACYKRVGTEYIGDVVEMFRLRGMN